MKKIWIIIAALLACSPAIAQWQVPDHSVPIGRGAGTGFKNSAPGTAGLPLISNGASSDPTFQAIAVPITGLPSDSTMWRTVTSADPIVNTDCWKTVALGGNALYAETFPASLVGFSAGCRIRVKNTDIYTGPGTGRGKQLINAPSDLFPMLYPQQVLEVQVVNGALVTTLNPGRWIVPQTVTLCVDTSGNDTTGDGLVALATAGAGCLRTNNKAGQIILTRFDQNQTTTIIAPTIGQSFTDQLNLGGTPLGGNLIQWSPNGAGTVNWSNAGPCINLSDLAELDIRLNGLNASGNVSFTCNTSNAVKSGHILNHNHVVLDMEGGPPVFHLAGANDNAIFWDGKGIATIANGVVVGGTGFSVGYLDQGAKVTWSGGTNPSIGITGAPTLTNLWTLNGGSELIIGALAPTAAGYTSLGPTTISTGSTLIQSGLAIPGGVIAPNTGGQNCVTVTNCNPWLAFTPSAACGTATITNTSATALINGKTTNAQVDFTITAIGTCTTAFSFTLPNTANSGGSLFGEEITAGKGVVCRVVTGSATSNCVKTDVSVWLLNDHFVASGTYNNQ